MYTCCTAEVIHKQATWVALAVAGPRQKK